LDIIASAGNDDVIQDNKIPKLSHDDNIESESKDINIDDNDNNDIEIDKHDSIILPYSESFYNEIKSSSTTPKLGRFNINHESFFHLTTKTKNYSNIDSYTLNSYDREVPVLYQLETPCPVRHAYQSNSSLAATFSYYVDISSSKQSSPSSSYLSMLNLII
jgi:hypothetical protein